MLVQENDANSGLQATSNLKGSIYYHIIVVLCLWKFLLIYSCLDFWNDDESSQDPQQFGIADSFAINMNKCVAFWPMKKDYHLLNRRFSTKTHEKVTSTYIPISTDVFELFGFAMPLSTYCGPRIVSTLDDLNSYNSSQNISQGLSLFYNNTGACGLLSSSGWCPCNIIREN